MMSGEKKTTGTASTRSGLILYPAFIFAFAVAVHLFLAFTHPPGPHLHDEAEYDQLACSILDGKGFTRPDGSPTASRPPLYPVLVALIYWLFGPGDTAVFLIQGILHATTCVLIYFMGRIIYGNPVGLIAGLGGALYPMLIFPAHDLLSESLLVFLFTTALFVLCANRGRYRMTFWAGFLLALSLLTKPVALFAVPFFAIWIWRNQYEKKLKAVCLFLLAIVLVLLPWTVRNYRAFDTFVPFTTGGGLAFYNSYVLPPRGLGFNSLDGIPPEFFTIENEAEQSRYLTDRTLGYISNHPLEAGRLLALKVFLFLYPLDGYWYSLSLGSKYNIFWGVILSFSILGFFSRTADPSARELLFVALLSVSLLALVLAGIPRYRITLEPVFLLFASSGITRLWSRSERRVFLIMGAHALVWLFFRFSGADDLLRWEKWSAFF
jgi:4-amino-4-deoxy-L-arabinose transferase-like glycosyltransferase